MGYLKYTLFAAFCQYKSRIRCDNKIHNFLKKSKVGERESKSLLVQKNPTDQKCDVLSGEIIYRPYG